MSSVEDKTASDEGGELNLGHAVDMSTFNQILEMDEPGNTEFSHSIVFGFFDQAEETFARMDEALTEKDLPQLSSLGHFLKGSSATLGLVKVRDGCEKIQRFGKNENVDGSAETDNEVCLKRITEALALVKMDYEEVEKTLKQYYEKHEQDKDDA